MTGTNRWWRATAGAMAAICLAIVAIALSSVPAEAVVTVKVATNNGSRGGPLTLTLSMTREAAEEMVATLQADVIFDNAQLDLVGRCGNGDPCRLTSDCPQDDVCQFVPTACQKDPRLTQQRVDVIPPDFQNVQPGQRRIRFAVLATQLPVPTFTDGNLVTCTFHVQDTAPLGQVSLSGDRLQVADNSIPARPLPAALVIEAGTVSGGTPGPTATATGSVRPTGTPATATPVGGSPTPTEPNMTPTPTSSGATPTPTTGQRTPCPSARPSPAGPSLYVEDLNLAMSGGATVTIRLVTGGFAIAGTQNDLDFSANVVINRKANGRPDCAVNPEIDKGATSFGFRPPACTEGACTGVRALVLSTDNTTPILDSSVLYTCNVTVTGEGGTLDVSGVIMSGPTGQRIDGASGRGGEICVEPSATPTPSPTAPGTGASATPTRSPGGATPTATSGQGGGTATPSRTNTPRTTPTATSSGSGGGGDGGGGCNCSIGNNGEPQGVSSVWLAFPAGLLIWRRRLRR